MVWRKVIVSVALCLLLSTSWILQASAATPYDGTISTTYITIFEDVVSKIGVNDDYLFYRSGQYEYTMVTGDLEYDGTDISGSGVISYVLTYSQNYGSDNYYHWEVSDISSFSLAVGDYLVYSNLGNFPSLEGGSVKYEFIQTLVLCVIGLCFVVRSVFGFCYRSRT